ncbi:hypothetical protein [Kordiimonas laminariae]|uniref:hypothetical protein n=1 Tax=Kordiimonas laminariae TaxID=2917717 RepID=UPI001FF33A8A|nr:hypothetical protein [Kordiimonas laminariae]MCK0067934.1 hypothetical protein [Kordiimonas laminariae]
MEQFFFSETTRYIFAMWKNAALQSPHICPHRSDINFEALPSEHEANTALLAYIDTDTIIIARCGANITRNLKQDISGHNILAYRDKEKQLYEIDYYERLVKTPAIGFIERQISDINGRKATLSSLHLPMADYNDEVTYLFSICSTHIDGKPIEDPALTIIPQSRVIRSDYMPLDQIIWPRT